MPAKLAPELQLTVEEFLAFTQTRPDEERWELIEGVPVMNASPTNWHQFIVRNLVFELGLISKARRLPWVAVPGIGTHVPASRQSLPTPDVQVLSRGGGAVSSSTTTDALVLFEVLSKSNTKADQSWRRKVYASIPNCQHYVTVSTKSAEVVRYDRADGWKGEHLNELDASLDLPAIDVTIPLRDIYRWTPIK